MKNRDPLNLIICGTGGQGNVLVSRLMARMFAKKGYNVTIGETFGMSQRGGNVMSHVRVSQTRSYGPLIPKGQGRIILSIEPMETIRVLGVYGNPDIEIITNTRPVYPISAITGESDYPGMEEIIRVIKELSAKSWSLDATQISLDMGNPILTNMIMMGAFVGTKVTELTITDLEGVLQDTFAKKIAKTNTDAANRGIQAVRKQ